MKMKEMDFFFVLEESGEPEGTNLTFKEHNSADTTRACRFSDVTRKVMQGVYSVFLEERRSRSAAGTRGVEWRGGWRRDAKNSREAHAPPIPARGEFGQPMSSSPRAPRITSHMRRGSQIKSTCTNILSKRACTAYEHWRDRKREEKCQS
jgi:hypothetical protein